MKEPLEPVRSFLQKHEMGRLQLSEKLSIPEMRRLFNERQKRLNAHLPDFGLTIWDEQVGAASARIYRPKTPPPYKCLLFFHGGGFVLGNLDTLELFCRELASSCNVQVISLDYPLAPENPYPAAARTLMTASHAIYNDLEKWQVSKGSFFVGGSSSGATLAATLCQRDAPPFKGQILLCPMTDTNFDTSSYRENGEHSNITREQCIWFASQYAQNREEGAWPLQAQNLYTQPPALIVTAELDPLRDDSIAYSEKLEKAGFSQRLLCYEGMVHGFFTLPLKFAQKDDLFREIHSHLKQFSVY